MFHHRFITRVSAILAVAITLATLNLATSAQGLVVKTDRVGYNGGTVDFGSGFHGTGHPFDLGSVKWEFSTVNGSLVVKATVSGTLYWDSLDSAGCGRLIVSFLQSPHGAPLESRTFDTQCPAPGGDANLSSNQKAVNASFASSNLNLVVLLSGPLVNTSTAETVNPKGGAVTTSTVGNFQVNSDKSFDAPSVKKHDLKINNGNSDFGSGLHALGGPSGNAVVQLSRVDGNVTGLVNGTLYWDALLNAGCARMIIDFQTSGGTTLSSKTIDQCGPGGNANDSGNKTDVNQSYNNGSLMQIRLRVGTLAGNNMVNVQTKTCNFKECN